MWNFFQTHPNSTAQSLRSHIYSRKKYSCSDNKSLFLRVSNSEKPFNQLILLLVYAFAVYRCAS